MEGIRKTVIIVLISVVSVAVAIAAVLLIYHEISDLTSRGGNEEQIPEDSEVIPPENGEEIPEGSENISPEGEGQFSESSGIISLGTLETSLQSKPMWDEFLATSDSPVVDMSNRNLSSVRQWIGHSTCSTCTPGISKYQSFKFSSLSIGSKYRLRIYFGYSSDTIMRATVTSGTAEIYKGGYHILPYGYLPSKNMWEIVFTPQTTSVTIKVGNDLTKGVEFAYFDYISFSSGYTETPTYSSQSTTYVSNISTLSSAIQSASAGQTIVLNDGTYVFSTGGYTITNVNGNSQQPLIIKARNRGGAIISGTGGIRIVGSSWVIIDGLKFENWSSQSITVQSSENIRITNNVFDQNEKGVKTAWIHIFGSAMGNNRIDHNVFQNKQDLGNVISIDGDSTKVSQFNRIDHNIFENIGERTGQNGKECIRVGSSLHNNAKGYNIIERNLFLDADGDAEVISVKSSANIVWGNTFSGSRGTITLRGGMDSVAAENYFENGLGGIRVYDSGHLITGNYFISMKRDGTQAVLTISNGTGIRPSTTTPSHYRPINILVENNTFYNNIDTIEIGNPYFGTIPPKSITIRNNRFYWETGSLVKVMDTASDVTWVSNYYYGPTTSLGESSTGFIKVGSKSTIQEYKSSGVIRLDKVSTLR